MAQEVRLEWRPFNMPGLTEKETRDLITQFMWYYRSVCGLRVRWAPEGNDRVSISGTTSNLGGHGAYFYKPRRIVVAKLRTPWVRLREGLPFGALVAGHELGHYLDHKYDLFGPGNEHNIKDSIMNYTWAYDFFSHSDIVALQKKFGPPRRKFWPQPIQYWGGKIRQYRDAPPSLSNIANLEKAIRVWNKTKEHYKDTPWARTPIN